MRKLQRIHRTVPYAWIQLRCQSCTGFVSIFPSPVLADPQTIDTAGKHRLSVWKRILGGQNMSWALRNQHGRHKLMRLFRRKLFLSPRILDLSLIITSSIRKPLDEIFVWKQPFIVLIQQFREIWLTKLRRFLTVLRTFCVRHFDLFAPLSRQNYAFYWQPLTGDRPYTFCLWRKEEGPEKGQFFHREINKLTSVFYASVIDHEFRHHIV